MYIEFKDICSNYGPPRGIIHIGTLFGDIPNRCLSTLYKKTSPDILSINFILSVLPTISVSIRY